MKKNYLAILCAAGIQLMCASLSDAQSTTLTLKVPPGAVVIDGNGKDWGDTLSFYNTDRKVRYTIANDKDNIYLIVKTKDHTQETNILGGGLTFAIDVKGRKRTTFATTFPSEGETTQNTGEKIGDEPLAQKATFAGLTRYKKIEVNGFKDISEYYLSTTNDYSIQAAVNYDDQGYLVYEEAIPLRLFHADDLMKNEWSFNIKLNGIDKTTMSPSNTTTTTTSAPARGGGGRSPMGGSPTSSLNSTPQVTRVTYPIDFWGKFNLAKVL